MSSFQRGFTLVELLITVAIIGVLSVIGVPTYRKMIQKAKQAEAKVNLAALYKSEAAFHAEFDTYGTNLFAMGFAPEPAANWIPSGAEIATFPGLNYTVGFSRDAGTCGPIEPDLLVPKTYAPLLAKQPSYGTKGTPVYFREFQAIGFGWCPDSEYSADKSGRMVSYRATASGVISPAVTESDVTSASPIKGNYDAWSIGSDRVLRHDQDGVK